MLQVASIHIRHGNKAQRSHRTHVMNAQNVAVGNLAGENQFLFESLQRVALADHAFANHLDRYRAIEVLVVGLVNTAHPAHALANYRFDTAVRNRYPA